MDSLGERYIRYNQFSEDRVLPLAGRDPAAFYGPDGALKPEYREHVERLRELRAMEKAMVVEGAGLRAAMARMDR
jgi:hypothetical protein